MREFKINKNSDFAYIEKLRSKRDFFHHCAKFFGYCFLVSFFGLILFLVCLLFNEDLAKIILTFCIFLMASGFAGCILSLMFYGCYDYDFNDPKDVKRALAIKKLREEKKAQKWLI